jgi:hypothetical protein
LLRAYLEEGSQKQAAHRMGVSYDYFRRVLAELYHELGVSSHLEALHALGWVTARGTTQGRRGRPRGITSIPDVAAVDAAVEAIRMTGVYPSQELVAGELCVEVRTLQRFLARNDLAWPPGSRRFAA